LAKEGISKGVYKTGDVMYDAVLQYTPRAQEKSKILEKLNLRPKDYILATLHRAENTDDQSRLKNIITAFNEITKQKQIVLPLHPRTRKMIKMFELDKLLNSCIVIDPVGFLDMICLEHNAKLIMTDSGGVQKEAYFHKVPCMTLRDETEWVETVESGWNILVTSLTTQNIIRLYKMVTSDNSDRNNIYEYGDGHASDSILNILKTFINNSNIVNRL
jgi:UDP-N-acetylglucosamine 2-epimerase